MASECSALGGSEYRNSVDSMWRRRRGIKYPPPPTPYTLTVISVNPATGVGMTVSPADNNGAANGNAAFTRTYNSGTTVTVTAPATAGNNTFASWAGCTTSSTVTCHVTLSANTTVTATFAAPKTTPTVTVTPASFSITTAQALSVGVSRQRGQPAILWRQAPLPCHSGSLHLVCRDVVRWQRNREHSCWVTCRRIRHADRCIHARFLEFCYLQHRQWQTSAAVTVAGVISTVAIDQASIGPAVSDKLLGMNMAAWYDPTTSAVVPAFQMAGIQTVRWPGGSWSDDYHWATNTMCGNTPNSNATFTKFVNYLVVPGNFDVALTANYGTNSTCNGPGQPSEAAAWITQAKVAQRARQPHDRGQRRIRQLGRR